MSACLGIAARHALALDSLGASTGGALVGDVRVGAASRAIPVHVERVPGKPVEEDGHPLV